MKLKINNKDYELALTWKTYVKICKRMTEMSNKDMPLPDMINIRGRTLIDNLWDCLKPGIFFKPYIFKRRLFKKISAQELLDSDKIIASLIKLEDREGENSEEKKPTSS